jgi:hypothetical protein
MQDFCAAPGLQEDRNSMRTLKAACAATLLAMMALSPASAGDLFGSPGLGLTPLTLPRVVPRPSTAAPGYTANQCQMMAGTCPTGRLMRSGTRCYCASADGTVRQGTSRKRPQGS